MGRNYFHPDLWLRTLEKKILDDVGFSDYVIDDCRFPNEVELIKSMGGKIILVERGDRPEWWDVAYKQNNGEADPDDPRMEKHFKSVHPSEWKWISRDTIVGATTIYNKNTLAWLHDCVEAALRETVIRT